MKKLTPLVLIIFILASCGSDKPEVKLIKGEWEFRRTAGFATGGPEDNGWYPASVPGTVHTDLFDNKLVPDPFFGENEKDLQWIGESEWEYRSSFFSDPSIMEKENVELVFEGLDTYATVFLNGEQILSADNMFRKWQVDVKKLLLDGSNELSVVFFPPGEVNRAKAEKLSYRLPDNRAFTRKPPYHFGWDWGPEFVTCGIWKPAYLIAWNDFRIDHLHIQYSSVDQDPLPVKIHVEVLSEGEHDARIQVFDDDGKRIAFEKVELTEGLNEFVLNVEIEDPELWWPSGLGDQVLYTFRVKVIGGGVSDERSATFGIRDIQLIREPDEKGETFFFEVNGYPVFMKGANYVPQDNFLPRVDTARYERLIHSVLDANMNMLRVWGGGFYENDIFYDLCDKNGILVWQDFMFACNMYPGDDAFLRNVRQEAVDNVRRLSNHPCIALWCGNNEVDEGWHNWGWQEDLEYTYEDSTKAWNDYLKLFHGILPEVVEKYDPGTIYHPSSPMTGWGRDEAYRQGDVHYWGVWWGEFPFHMYKEKVGRFVSEYGFQGMPPIETIESFGGLSASSPGPAAPNPGVLESHQKHPRGTELIQKYMERDYMIPEDFEDYVYVSQVLQAEGMAQAFLTHRISRPYCMGTLYWQLNDCWPVTSWSGIDYYGRWKALHYHAKRAYEPIMLSVLEKDGLYEVYAVNDLPHEAKVGFTLETYSVDQRKNVVRDKIISLPPLAATRIDRFPGPNEDRKRYFVKAGLQKDGKTISGSFTYFVPTKELDLDDPGLSWEIDGNEIRIYSEKLARQVFLEARGLEGRFSDNFFDMAPGESREVIFTGKADEAKLYERLNIKSIYDTYN